MTWLSEAVLGKTRRARVSQASFNCARSIELDCQKYQTAAAVWLRCVARGSTNQSTAINRETFNRALSALRGAFYHGGIALLLPSRTLWMHFSGARPTSKK